MTDPDTQARIVSGLAQPPAGGSHARGTIELDGRTYDQALACVHCGFCLPACPTYTLNGLEADSPRGRIMLMRGLAEGRIGPTGSVLNHLDLCLDCCACETACPSGVVYHELIEEARSQLLPRRKPTFGGRLVRLMALHLFPHPHRLRFGLLPARVLQKLGLWRLVLRSPLVRLLGSQMLKMLQMLPERGPLWERNLDPVHPADAPDGRKRATVYFFAGCIGSVVQQDVNRKAIRILQHLGCDVVVPRSQRCCGAMHHHGGHAPKAQRLARANIDAFQDVLSSRPPSPRTGPVYITTTIAGCGAMLREYGHLLRDDHRYAERAGRFVNRVRDITELLVELDPPKPTRPIKRTVTYHDACHLAHAQGVTDPPRQLLSLIEGLDVVPLAESDICCGSAGTYNLSQPAMSRQLGERKIRNIERSGAQVCVTGNIGCALQIQSEADRLGLDLEVSHPVTLLHEAYFGNRTPDRA